MTATPRSAFVALIRPSRPTETAAEVLHAAQAAAERAGHTARSFGTKPARLPGEQVERRLTELLEPNDAHRIYDALHSSDALVLAVEEAFVRRDPRRTPATRRHALSLETFVRHKSMFCRLRHAQEVERAFHVFEEWRASPAGCSGFNDPRVLPLHVFEVDRDWSELGEPSVDAEFAKRYGKSSDRRDAESKRWARATAFHGQKRLTIARHELEPGAHWDVTAPNSATLLTSHQVWKMKSKSHDYLNVYPNEFVRKTTGSTCKLIFPTR
jgi:hypothetical protein